MKININKIKKLLKDKEFTKKLPDNFAEGLKKFEEKPDCPCHHELYFRILKEAQDLIIEHLNKKNITAQSGEIEETEEEKKIEFEEFADFLKSIKYDAEQRKATIGSGGGMPDFESEIENEKIQKDQQVFQFDGSFDLPNEWLLEDGENTNSNQYNFEDKIINLKNGLYKNFPLDVILKTDNYESWSEENKGPWGHGELKEIDENEFKNKLISFRNEKFAGRILDYLQSNQFAPIVILSKKNKMTVTDGHGRVTVAYGLGFTHIPAIFFEVKIEKANNNT
jgi:hypothetical protein